VPRPVRDERRAALLSAARAVFAQKGYHAATVDDITRLAGVAKGTFYLHFEEKREIYVEVVRAFLELVKDIGRSIGAARGDAAAFFAQADHALRELVRVFFENREVARLAARESMGFDPELEVMIRDFYREIAEVQAQNIRRGIELGLFRPVDPMLAAYAHIGMLERVILASFDGGLAQDPAVLVREMMGLAFEGLRLTR
jgi:AcrR family transcriptional regulator